MPMPGSETWDEDVLEELQSAVTTARNEQADVLERVKAVELLHNQAGWGENTREALAAGTMDALVHLATTDWPAAGDLAASPSPLDAAVQPEGSGGCWRSIRSAAVSALAEMSNYQPLAQGIVVAIQFAGDAVPRMLHDSLPRYPYGVSYAAVGRGRRHLQAFLGERLLNLLANCVALSEQVMRRCGDAILDGYDAFAELKAEGMADRGEGAGAARRGGEDEEGSEDGYDEDWILGPDNMLAEDYCRFWANGMRWVTSPAEQDRLVAKGLVGRLRQTESTAMSGRAMAVKLRPSNAKAWCRAGDAYHEMEGRAPLALLCYETAASLAPGDAEIAARDYEYIMLMESSIMKDEMLDEARMDAATKWRPPVLSRRSPKDEDIDQWFAVSICESGAGMMVGHELLAGRPTAPAAILALKHAMVFPATLDMPGSRVASWRLMRYHSSPWCWGEWCCAERVAARLVAWITLPSLILQSFNRLSLQQLPLLALPLSAAAVALSAATGWLAWRQRHPKERGLLAGSALGGSVALAALPLAQALAGAAGLHTALLAGAVNSLAVWGASLLLFGTAGAAFPEAQAHDGGGSYRGEWKGMLKEGLGAYAYPSGARYEGASLRRRAAVAVKLRPSNAKAWCRAGDAYHEMEGRAPLALLCYETAASLAPGDAEIAARDYEYIMLMESSIMKDEMLDEARMDAATKWRPPVLSRRSVLGEWRNNLKEGRGVYRFPKGGVYEGEWRAGAMAGVGVRTLSSGRVQAGVWERGKLAAEMEEWQCALAVEGANEAAAAARRVRVGEGGAAEAAAALAAQPATWAYALAAALVVLGRPLAPTLDLVTSQLAGAHAPLALLVLGLTLDVSLPPLRQASDVAAALAVRLVPPLLLALAACAALSRVGWAPHEVLGLMAPLVACWVAPVSPQALAYAHRFRLNESLAAAIASTGSGTCLAAMALSSLAAVLAAATGSLLPFCGALAGMAGALALAAAVLSLIDNRSGGQTVGKDKVRMVYAGTAAPAQTAGEAQSAAGTAAAPAVVSGVPAPQPPGAAASEPARAADLGAEQELQQRRRSAFSDVGDGGAQPPSPQPPAAAARSSGSRRSGARGRQPWRCVPRPFVRPPTFRML
eukprot:scaffold14.g1349.t1